MWLWTFVKIVMCRVIFQVGCIHGIPAKFGEKHTVTLFIYNRAKNTQKAIDRQQLLFVPCAGWQLGNWVRPGLLSTDIHPVCISSTEQAICAKQVLGSSWNEASMKAYPGKLLCRAVKASACQGDQAESLCCVSMLSSPVYLPVCEKSNLLLHWNCCPVVTVDVVIGWV